MKNKRIPLIIAAVIFVAGIVLIIIGIAVNGGAFSKYPALDPFCLSDEDVGKTFSGRLYADSMPVENTKNGKLYILLISSSEDDPAETVLMCCFVPSSVADRYDHPKDNRLDVCGTVNRCSDELTEKAKASLINYFNDIKSLYEEMGLGEDVFESDLNNSLESISPYSLDAVEAENGNVYIWIGGAVIAVALFILLTTLLGKKFLIVFGVVVILPSVILLVVYAGRLRTMATVTEVSEGLYTMVCHYNYDCDKFLDADIGTIDELAEWMRKELFFGWPIEFDEGNLGCAAFTAETPEGHRLFARNFDYDDTDTLVIYTEPKDGYASLGVVDLRFFDIGTEDGLDGNSLPAKAMMLCTPYVVMDGINEEGVGVGILQLDIAELHQDGGRPDLLISSAIRGILDKCANVSEALALLEKYDIQSFLGVSYHLFITDKTGRSVIVEWTDSETFIVEDTACTNEVMSVNEFYDPEWSCARYDIIKSALSNSGGILTADEAMSVAADANRGDTQWSCVYDLDEFTLDICLDTDYENKYSFTREFFK